MALSELKRDFLASSCFSISLKKKWNKFVAVLFYIKKFKSKKALLECCNKNIEIILTQSAKILLFSGEGWKKLNVESQNWKIVTKKFCFGMWKREKGIKINLQNHQWLFAVLVFGWTFS